VLGVASAYLAASGCAGDRGDEPDGRAPSADPAASSPSVAPPSLPSLSTCDPAGIDASAKQVIAESATGVDRGWIDVFGGSVHARFFGSWRTPSSSDEVVTIALVGACELQEVRPPESWSPIQDLKTQPTLVPAGNVAVYGTTSGTCGTRLDYVSEYYAVSAPVWSNPGEIVTVRATGDASGVPPFSKSFAAPAPVESLTPALGGIEDGVTISISRSTDLAFSWTAQGPGTTTVQLDGTNYVDDDAGTDRAGDRFRIVCTAETAVGSVTVPKELLAQWPADGTARGGVRVQGGTKESFVVGKYALDLNVLTPLSYASFVLVD
jgi:hypothetical protein